MKWFEGGIPAAIQTARQNKAIFIVFISKEDDTSKKMESELHQQNVTQLCEENRCVSVKLLAESNDSKFFSQIYSGVPLEVIGEVKSSQDFYEKIKAALEMQKNRVLPNQPSQPEQLQRQPAPQPQPVVAEEVSTLSSRAEQGASSDGSGDDGASASSQPDLSDRVEKAKQLLEEKREDRARKELEEQKKKEQERRNVGQGVQKLRQSQKEMEILEAKKELKREKEEDRLARQRVKEEIARDRAEKAARFQKEKDDRAKATEESKKQKLFEQQAAQAAEQARRSEFARIQFRLPDGSSLTQQFSARDRFEAVFGFITRHVGSSVSLSTTFPRHTFTQSDHNLTLQELNLAPSAAILVIPTFRLIRSNGAFSWTSILFAPFIFVWNIFSSLFGLGGSSTSSNASVNGNAPKSSAQGGDRRPDSAYRRGSSSSRQEGSIHRFHNAQDDENDDDRNTWNGNSTQQM